MNRSMSEVYSMYQKQGRVYHEYILVYAKKSNLITTPKSANHERFEAGALKKVDDRHPLNEFTFPKGTRFDAPDGTELTGSWGGAEQVKIVSGRLISDHGRLKDDVTLAAGFTQIKQMHDYFDGKDVVDTRGQKVVEFYLNSTGKSNKREKRGDTCYCSKIWYTGSGIGSLGSLVQKLCSIFFISKTGKNVRNNC